jgi:hypothetical protein
VGEASSTVKYIPLRLYDRSEHRPLSVVRCVNCPARLRLSVSRNHSRRSEHTYISLNSQLHSISSFPYLPAMSTSVPSTLLVTIYTSYILFTRAEVPSCFYPYGGHAKGDFACNLTAEASFCCAIDYNFLGNKICTGPGDLNNLITEEAARIRPGVRPIVQSSVRISRRVVDHGL